MENNIFSTKYHCKIPSSLDLDSLLQNNPITVSQYKADPITIRNNLAYIINCLSSAILSKHQDTVTDEFISLSSVILHSVVRNHNEYINYLIVNNVIVSDTKYKPGIKSIGYKFTFDVSSFNNYYIYDPKIINKINHSMKSNFKRQHPEYAHLLPHFQDLSYDYDQALSLIATLKDPLKQQRAWESLNKIGANNNFWTVDRSGRFYSCVTMLPKIVRPALRWKNQPLVEHDLKCAVPFLTLPLLNPLNWDNTLCEIVMKWNPNIILPSTSYIPLDTYSYPINKDYTILYRDPKFLHHFMCAEIGHRDIELYSQLVLSNDQDLYQYLIEYWKSHPAIKSKAIIDRDFAKKKLLQIFNSPSFHSNIYRITLSELFPNVLAIFDWINTGYTRTNGMGRNKYDLHCPFAHIGFNLESNFIIKNVTKKISTINSGPLFTIHDAILCLNQDSEIITHYLNYQHN
jgi:hypothetical protein